MSSYGQFCPMGKAMELLDERCTLLVIRLLDDNRHLNYLRRGVPKMSPALLSKRLRTLTQIWRGDVSWSRALLDGSVSIDAPSDVRRAVPRWGRSVEHRGGAAPGVKRATLASCRDPRAAY
jgi:hypothetical protein